MNRICRNFLEKAILNVKINGKKTGDYCGPYVEMGKNDTGPIKQKAVAINMLPMRADIFGCKNLSTKKPQTGAVHA